MRLIGEGSGALFSIGEQDAEPIVLFTNLSCAYCTQFWQKVVPQLRRDFIDAGALRLHVVLLPMEKYPLSATDAAALFCAGRQEKSMEMHDAIVGIDARTAKALSPIAASLDMDSAAFLACLNSEEAIQVNGAQAAIAASLNVSLAPTVLLRGERFVGLPAYTDLRTWIEHIIDE